jgi:hypothetical protein
VPPNRRKFIFNTSSYPLSLSLRSWRGACWLAELRRESLCILFKKKASSFKDPASELKIVLLGKQKRSSSFTSLRTTEVVLHLTSFLFWLSFAEKLFIF